MKPDIEYRPKRNLRGHPGRRAKASAVAPVTVGSIKTVDATVPREALCTKSAEPSHLTEFEALKAKLRAQRAAKMRRYRANLKARKVKP